MLGILAFITGLAGPIQYITAQIAALGIAKAKADTDTEKQKLDAAIQEAHDRQQILVAEAANRFAVVINALVRFSLTLGPIAILLKLFVWDKVIGSFQGCAGAAGKAANCITFNTDPLDQNQWLVITAVIAFYFGYDIIARFRR